VVPQLLSEIDGVEGLENVIVIGASNREDMIDRPSCGPPPGREDQDRAAGCRSAQDIFSKYLTEDLPCTPTTWPSSVATCADRQVDDREGRRPDVRRDRRQRFLEVTYANGDKEVMYFKDFNSGAMIQNVVDRAKKYAIKSVLETGQKGLRIQHLLDSIVDEFAENEICPTPPIRTTGPGSRARRASGSSTSDAGHRQSSSAQPRHRHREQPGSVPLTQPTRTAEMALESTDSGPFPFPVSAEVDDGRLVQEVRVLVVDVLVGGLVDGVEGDLHGHPVGQVLAHRVAQSSATSWAVSPYPYSVSSVK
jgi:SpoVK/Ycf46/Vps4 family AAA+-type ATPase